MKEKKYTWNDRGIGNRIQSKIDCMFINLIWLNSMSSCGTLYPPEGISGHCPSKVYLQNQVTRTRRAFQYCNVWAQHSQFNDRIQEVWDTHVEECKMWKVVKILKLLKPGLKKLNTHYFRNIVTDACEDREALLEVQQKL